MIKQLNPFNWFKSRRCRPSREGLSNIFKAKYERFKELLDSNAELSRIITDLEEKLLGRQLFGMSYVRSQSARAVFHTLRMVKSLNAISGNKYATLLDGLEALNSRIKEELGTSAETAGERSSTPWVVPHRAIRKDMVDWVGGKNANLGEVLNGAGLPIPEGFAITTAAYEYFLKSNDLVDEINRIKMELDPASPESIERVSEDIQRLIISAPMPADLKEAILDAYDRMTGGAEQKDNAAGSGDGPGDALPVALRSSAIGEDSELSFAGQYLSVLNVPRSRLVQTYAFVVASLFTPRAISYRLNKGIRDEDIAMSVACLPMVTSVASGVAYSRHPFNLLDDRVLISAVWGLGPYAVDGTVIPDTYSVARGSEPVIGREPVMGTELIIEDRHVPLKPVQLLMNPEGGLMEAPVPHDLQELPCLTDDRIRLLAGYVLRLEEHYGGPQDVEWALDAGRRLLILQTRPLRLEAMSRKAPSQAPIAGAIPISHPLLLDGATAAFPGVGTGPVFRVRTDDDLARFPDGAVLVAPHSSPKYVVVMPRAAAIVTDTGSITGHMASLSREFGVPTLLGAKGATSLLTEGREVTVDAYSGRVYEGRVKELLGLQVPRESHMSGTPVHETLKRLAALIVPLRLLDPRSPQFAPESCRTLHDIMRYVHEMSYREMFQISDLVSDGEGCAVKLLAPIPLDLHVIDLGGGISPSANPRQIRPEDVSSEPFKALLIGMLHEGVRTATARPRPVELKGFFSVMSEQMLSSSPLGERFGDRSYAIVSDKYLNFSSRVGYHYSILDAYCGQTMNKNYITFSFKGGAADDVRRNRRVRSIALILEGLGFTVEVAGDRVDARFQKYEAAETAHKLDLVGRLIIFTRQMDMLMHSETSVAAIAKAFLAEDYHLDEVLAQSEVS